MSRFVIVEMPPRYLKRCAFVDKVPGTSWQELVDQLSLYSTLNQEITWTQNGLKTYVDFYEKMIPTGDVQRDAYQERETEQIVKLSMLLAISENRYIIDSKHMNQARKILNSLMEETKPRIERLTTHPRMRLVQEIQDLLRSQGGIKRRALLKRVYRSLSHGEQQFQEAIRILNMAEIIQLTGAPDNPMIKLKEK